MFKGGGKRILGEVYSSYLGIVSQSINDQLNVRSGGCLASRRHEDNDFFRREDRLGGNRTRAQGTNDLCARIGAGDPRGDMPVGPSGLGPRPHDL